MIKCFFAFSDNGNKVSDSINEAVNDVNAGQHIEITSWNVMAIQGTSIPMKVIDSIDKCDYFLCDNSNLNDNVLFELGYAIGKKKPVRIYINPSINGVSDEIKKFDLLSTIGYQEYSNSQQLSQCIWRITEEENDSLWEKLEEKNNERPVTEIFYLKSIIESEQSLWVSSTVKKLGISCYTDDPEEMVRQSLNWYVDGLIYSNGLIAYLQDNLSGSALRNNTISFIAGLAMGLSLPVLLLATDEYKAPMDYKEQVVRFSNREQCEKSIREWYEANKESLKQDTLVKTTGRNIRQRNKLQALRIGQSIAENEPEELLKYFIETSAYREAKSKNLSLFVGRKGVGKTANLIKLADELEGPNRHICVIKPIQYEIDGVIELMNKLTSAEKSYLVQSIWKYLIYTELLKNIYVNLDQLPAYYEKNHTEQEIYKFVKDNEGVILNEFSERTQKIIEELLATKVSGSNQEEYRIKVSEILHDRIISKIRKSLSDYCGKKDRIVVLIDNLDKSWNVDSNIEHVSKFIFGLLDVGEGIVRDFSKDSNWNRKINITLVVFLREDIFSVIKKYAPEADKLQISKMVWNDNELLLRVVEERLAQGNDIDVWEEYFCKEIDGLPIKDYLIKSVLPKPRDLIYLVSMAIENAKNRKHSIVEENDIKDAVEKYSEFAFQTLITELQIEFPKIENFLLELLGVQSIIDQEKLQSYAMNVGIDSREFDGYVSMLCQMLFFGMEIKNNEFQFCYDIENYKKYKILSNRVALSSGLTKYKIHPAFHKALMIDSYGF